MALMMLFQSTSPVRGTTPILKDGDITLVISIHVPREGDDFVVRMVAGGQDISIHVPREGDDWQMSWLSA